MNTNSSIKNLSIVIFVCSLMLSINSYSSEPVMTDSQSKQLRETSQMVLNSRLIEKKNNENDLHEIRQSLAKLQSIIDRMSNTMMVESMKISSSITSDNPSLSGSGIIRSSRKEPTFHFDSATGKIVEKDQINKSTPQPIDLSNNIVEENLVKQSTKNNNSLKIMNQSLIDFQSKLLVDSPRNNQKSTLSLWDKTKKILGFSKQNYENKSDSISISSRKKLVSLAEEAQIIIKAYENNETDVFERVKALKKRVKLQTPSTQIPNVHPTLSNKNRHNNS